MSQERIDKRFGIVAIESGFITREQLIAAIEIQINGELEGTKNRLIGEILRDQRYITDAQINEVVRLMGSL